MERKDCRLTISQASEIPALVGEGLYAICICWRGSVRSCNAAEELSDLGHLSFYIEGGFRKLSDLSEADKAKFFGYISEAPNFIIMLDEFELSICQRDIAKIKRKEGRIIICDNIELIKKNYL